MRREAAISGGFSRTSTAKWRLSLKLGRDVCELGVEGAADGVDSRDDDNRDASRDQSVLDGRSAILISDKCKNLRHMERSFGFLCANEIGRELLKRVSLDVSKFNGFHIVSVKTAEC